MTHSLCCVLFQTSLSIWGWGGLGVVLFLITFGPFAIFYLAFYVLCFTGGCFAVTLLFGKTNSEKYLEKCEHSFLPATQSGIPKTLEEMKRESRQIKIDRRLTGASIIDEPLQQATLHRQVSPEKRTSKSTHSRDNKEKDAPVKTAAAIAEIPTGTAPPTSAQAWRPEAMWRKPAYSLPHLPRVDTFCRVPASHRDHVVKQLKVDTFMTILATGAFSKSFPPDRVNREIDTFLKRNYSASTCNMHISNSQVHAAKYQHKLWNQVPASLQTPTLESIELAMQLGEEGKNAAKINLQTACESIDSNARAVANVVSARWCLEKKTSSLTSDTVKNTGVPVRGNLLFGTGLKDSLAQMKEAR
ncbi:SNX13 protein, partial [Polyodon spathula]|nr:SNX13 protein [Polyodon spathula]